MRTLIWAIAGCAVLACAVPAKAVVVVPSAMVAPVDTASPSPLLQNVWWDRWHHWHHRHHHWHHYPR